MSLSFRRERERGKGNERERKKERNREDERERKKGEWVERGDGDGGKERDRKGVGLRKIDSERCRGRIKERQKESRIIKRGKAESDVETLKPKQKDTGRDIEET